MAVTAKNAVITGAASGIGKACVRAFSDAGINIYACLHQKDALFESEAEELAEKNGIWIRPIVLDLASEQSVKAGVMAIMQEKQKVDILVNAAGTVGENRLFPMTPMSEMRRVFDINFFGTMFLTQLISRLMMRQGSGAVVNVASIAALDGDPAQLEYSASKAAIVAATRKLARELGQSGIRVNAVAPGLTNTKMLDKMTPEMEQKMLSRMILKRRAEPGEIAEAILFLADDSASFITGQVLRVDGGVFA